MSWCCSFQQSLSSDSKWKASIMMPSSHSGVLNKEIKVTDDCLNHSDVDIVELLNNCNISLNILLQTIATSNNYPKDAIFQFEGFNNFNDLNQLVKAIKLSAFKHGTVLNKEKTYNISSSNPYYRVVIACAHYGKMCGSSSSKTKHTFSPNFAQANNTIIQQSHYSSSISKASRNSKFKRVNFSGTEKKLNRSNTKKQDCKFHFTIFFDPNYPGWFLKKRREIADNRYHCNHIYIDPVDLVISKNDITPNVKASILSLINSGTTIPSIILHIKHEFDINVSYNTVYSLRLEQLRILIGSCSNNPYITGDISNSPVDKLISIFKHTSNVSFVYIVHNYSSGFVTYRKSRSRDNNNSQSNKMFEDDSIQNWRDELKLKHTNDVLVAFAWAHDDELRYTEMYPEFLAADVTFGVNRQRGELLLVAGIDGRNRTFTSFRCFIPSKQEIAYSWIIKEAMPYLLSNDVLKYNQCITSDNEDALNKAIEASISSAKDAFKFSTLRLDCFHFYTKVWKDKIVLKAKDSTSNKEVLTIMNNWIMTWFKKVETKQEFEYSYSKFKVYFESKHAALGNTCVEHITSLLSKIVNSQHLLLHYAFKNICTFDFIGDSIVESANAPLKKGAISVNNSMDIACSGWTQIRSTEAKVRKENIQSASRINNTKIWTQSKTAEYLTDYAEGLACFVFDRKDYYLKRYAGNYTWYVCSKHLFDDKYTEKYIKSGDKPINFLHVRIVKITDDFFMNCSCGHEQRWLKPCEHMACVIENIDHYTPDLFHIRWWKHYHYLYKKKNVSHNEASSNDLQSSLQYSRRNHYCTSSGKWKGVPLEGTLFLNSIQNNITFFNNSISDDKEYRTMSAIVTMQERNIPLENGSLLFKNFMQSQDEYHDGAKNDLKNVTNQEEEVLNNNNQSIETMGVGSQVASQLSQYREDFSVDDASDVDSHISDKEIGGELQSAYSRLNPYFQQLLNSISNEAQIKEACNQLEKLTFKFGKEGMSGRVINQNETTFLGELNGSTRPEKRHRNNYEK